MNSVRYLTRKEIIDNRWNSRIEKSVNGLIYARTIYLDQLAGNWNALVSGDYECLMPLTGKKKYGTSYLYQPAFCQQLGIIGECSDVLQQAFLKKAMELYPFAEINLNFGNAAGEVQLCNNFIIDLGGSYESIAGRYSHDLKKNLQRCRSLHLEYREASYIQDTISLYKKTYGKRFPHVKEYHYQALLNFCGQYPEHCLVREVWSGEKLLSAVLCLTDSRRIYFLASTTLPEGRNMEANHFLVDRLILEFSGRPLTLDFEGSDIQGIAAFYKNFGAINQVYPKIKWNRLKWPWSMFRK
jgi:hypothetical protein